jgi:hypothetical protein
MKRKKRGLEQRQSKLFEKPAKSASGLNFSLIITLVLSFLLSFFLYWLTLAPTVTFEDSGELIAAAYTPGIPHQPGYPLFTLMGRIFSMLPFENIAYRLNLMSAFLSALGAMWLTWAMILLIEDCFIPGVKRKTKSLYSAEKADNSQILKYASALSAGILMATAFENWEQSIITEVYGLNTMFVGLILFLAVLWRRQAEKIARFRYFLLICFILGLTLSNHTTSLMFLPILLVFGLLEDRKFILNSKILLSGTVFLILGLTPYIYLPVASARNPRMDWGNPENLANFLRTVTRHQYGLGGNRSFARFLDQFSAYIDLLLVQWFPIFLIFALIGLFTLLKSRRIYFYFSLVFLLFAAPLTTYLTDFDVSTPDPFLTAENKALVSVFYIPSYIYLAFLTGIGLFYLATMLKSRFAEIRYVEYGLALLIVLLPLGMGYSNYQKLDMSRYYFTEDYAENLFKVAEKNALVVANWDPFYFPLNYYQFVEGRRPDLIAIDQELLRRSWYIHWLQEHYPEFIRAADREVEAFLAAVAPFENHQPYDGNFIQTKYIAMINALIDRGYENGRAVYFAIYKRPLPPGIAPGYEAEPMVAAFRLRKDANGITPLSIGELQFRYFFDDNVPKDRMALMMQEYYATLILNRAQYIERAGEFNLALKYYDLTKLFFSGHPRVIGQIDALIKKLEAQQ